MSDAETPLRDLDLEPDELALIAAVRYRDSLGSIRYQEAWAHEDPYLRAVRAADYAERYVMSALMNEAMQRDDPRAQQNPYAWAISQLPAALITRSSGALSAAAEPNNVKQHPLGLAAQIARQLVDALEER